MNTSTQFRIKSYVPRGRRTDAQERAYLQLWPHCGLEVAAGVIDYQQVFGRNASCYLEIGFGSGVSLLELAKLRPDANFIGVETHQPGIGALLQGIEKEKLPNLKIYYADVIDVLQQCIPPSSLDGIQIFFPDPWQKRRHRARRLIQADFVKLLISRLKKNAILHLATDWDDYAVDMMRVVSAEPCLINTEGVGEFAKERSSQRPVITKFEKRALREGRKIWEIQCRS